MLRRLRFPLFRFAVRAVPARSGALVLGVLLALLVPATAARGQSSAANGFQDIQVDLSGQIFTSILPFDVPFLIHGEVPAATSRVEVQFIGAKRPFRVCDPSVRRFQRQVAANLGHQAPCPVPDRIVCYAEARGGGEEPFDCAWQPERTGPISWVQQLPLPAGATTTTFRVAVPPLDANRFYAFKFVLDRKLTADELAQIRASVKAAADQALAGNTGNTAGDAENEAVRSALVQQLQKIAGSDLKVDSAHPLLDPAVPYASLPDAVKNDLSQRLGAVIRPQRDRERQLRLRADKQIRLEPRLKEIAGSSALDKLVAKLRERAASQEPGSAMLAEHLKRHEPALELAGLSQAETAQHATGTPRGDGAPPADLGAARGPNEAAPYVAAYGDTSERLADLQDWLDGQLQELGRGSAGAEAPLTGAELEELKTVLDSTVDAQDLAEQLADHAQSIQNDLAERAGALDALAAASSAQAAEADLLLPASSLGDFKTQQSYYIAADFGMAYGPGIDKAVPYFGTNLYFRPVNKNAPLSSRSSFGRRFAVTIGMTVKSIADANPQTRSDLFDANSLLVGAGYRVTDSARIGAGVLIFNERNPNPLLGGEKVTYSPYLSVSFDWDILSFFRGFSSIYGGQP